MAQHLKERFLCLARPPQSLDPIIAESWAEKKFQKQKDNRGSHSFGDKLWVCSVNGSKSQYLWRLPNNLINSEVFSSVSIFTLLSPWWDSASLSSALWPLDPALLAFHQSDTPEKSMLRSLVMFLLWRIVFSSSYTKMFLISPVMWLITVLTFKAIYIYI